MTKVPKSATSFASLPSVERISAPRVPGKQPSTPRASGSAALPAYPSKRSLSVSAELASPAVLRVQISDRAQSMFSRVDEARNSSPASPDRWVHPASCHKRPMLRTMPSSLSSTLWSFKGKPLRMTFVPMTTICAPPLPVHEPCKTSSVTGPVPCCCTGFGHRGALLPMQMKPSSCTGVPAGRLGAHCCSFKFFAAWNASSTTGFDPAKGASSPESNSTSVPANQSAAGRAPSENSSLYVRAGSDGSCPTTLPTRPVDLILASGADAA
mmetsp:Transcript_76591/g.212766  ORF Transcript_76591/g.212766 Transcript_76591/m.212766 type:complete len:268 (-) Transcript_76591:150-953(-)